MDLQNIGEFYCAVCFELFGENLKCPRILTCGHSFCHSCLESLLVQSPTCPNCKEGIQYMSVNCIPVNYLAKSFISLFNVNSPDSKSHIERSTVVNLDLKTEQTDKSVESLTLKKDLSSPDLLPYEGYCVNHNNYQQLRCMDCECWACGVCVALDHKPCRTLLVAEALNAMKQEIYRDVADEIEEQHSQNKNLDKYLKDMEIKRSHLKNKIKKLQLDLRSKIETLKSFGKNVEKLQLLKSEKKKYCAKIKLLETSVVASANEVQFRKATSKLKNILDQSRKLLEDLTIPRCWYGHLTMEVLRDWCQEGSVYASRPQNGSTQYGKVDVKGDSVFIYSFKPNSPKQTNVIISFRELLLTFNGLSGLPRRGFIQVEDGISILSDVVITTDALTPRAMNFLLLCSGIKGRSYEGDRFYSGLSLIETTFNKGGAVVKEIKDGGVYEAPRKKGFVLGEEVKYKDHLSRFVISMLDEPTVKSNTKFGFVEEGIKVCERIFNNENMTFTIKHCGLVI